MTYEEVQPKLSPPATDCRGNPRVGPGPGYSITKEKALEALSHFKPKDKHQEAVKARKIGLWTEMLSLDPQLHYGPSGGTLLDREREQKAIVDGLEPDENSGEISPYDYALDDLLTTRCEIGRIDAQQEEYDTGVRRFEQLKKDDEELALKIKQGFLDAGPPAEVKSDVFDPIHNALSMDDGIKLRDSPGELLRFFASDDAEKWRAGYPRMTIPLERFYRELFDADKSSEQVIIGVRVINTLRIIQRIDRHHQALSTGFLGVGQWIIGLTRRSPDEMRRHLNDACNQCSQRSYDEVNQALENLRKKHGVRDDQTWGSDDYRLRHIKRKPIERGFNEWWLGPKDS